jgi:hypothetical protein
VIQCGATVEATPHVLLWWTRSVAMPDLTRAERSLLRLIAEIGGRYTFRPDGGTRAAYAAFNRDTIAVLQSLQSKGFVAIDLDRSRPLGLRGSTRRYASMAVEMTQRGYRRLADG